ncbi:MAG: nucleotide exchange factor GrpE [Bacteroidetes bacterium]|nr:MAG: nucleotide exchange factor GrpE [Bacteroidota bacterium]
MAKQKTNEAENAQEELKNEELNQEQEDQQAEAKREGTSWEEKYAEVNDKYLRLYSEFDNFRKRTNKEKVELISTANAGVLKELLPVLDDFERAIQVNEKAEDLETLKEGFKLIYTKFKSTLEAKGLKEMDSKGKDFDSELHEAIANVPAPEASLKGKVVEDVEKGYFLNDRVVRYAKVVVGQ